MPKTLASTLHLLLCKKSHKNDGFQHNDCQWYIENQRAGYWDLSTHQKWIAKAQEMLRLSGRTEEELEELLRRLIGIITQISYLKEKNPTLLALIDTIIVEASNTVTIPQPAESKNHQNHLSFSSLPY